MSEHIKPEHSMALVALSADDPERLRAERHAATCSACRSALDEAQTMLGWVDAYAPLPAVDAALKARVRSVVFAAPAPTQKVVPSWTLALGMLVSTLLAWLDAEPGALAISKGIECMLFENMVAIAPLTIAAYLGMRGKIALAPLNLATVSMAGALVGQVVLQARCPVHGASHLLAFHVVGVALAAALGYLSTSGLTRWRDSAR